MREIPSVDKFYKWFVMMLVCPLNSVESSAYVEHKQQDTKTFEHPGTLYNKIWKITGLKRLCRAGHESQNQSAKKEDIGTKTALPDD